MSSLRVISGNGKQINKLLFFFQLIRYSAIAL